MVPARSAPSQSVSVSKVTGSSRRVSSCFRWHSWWEASTISSLSWIRLTSQQTRAAVCSLSGSIDIGSLNAWTGNFSWQWGSPRSVTAPTTKQGSASFWISFHVPFLTIVSKILLHRSFGCRSSANICPWVPLRLAFGQGWSSYLRPSACAWGNVEFPIANSLPSGCPLTR